MLAFVKPSPIHRVQPLSWLNSVASVLPAGVGYHPSPAEPVGSGKFLHFVIVINKSCQKLHACEWRKTKIRTSTYHKFTTMEGTGWGGNSAVKRAVAFKAESQGKNAEESYRSWVWWDRGMFMTWGLFRSSAIVCPAGTLKATAMQPSQSLG